MCIYFIYNVYIHRLTHLKYSSVYKERESNDFRMRKALGSNTKGSMASVQHPQWQDASVWNMITVFLRLTYYRNHVEY